MDLSGCLRPPPPPSKTSAKYVFGLLYQFISRLNNSERTRELGPEGLLQQRVCSDLIFNPGYRYRHSVMTDISWSNMPLIMFMGADILFVYFLFRCQRSASVGSILRQIFSSSFSRFIAHVIVAPPSEWVGQLMCITSL